MRITRIAQAVSLVVLSLALGACAGTPQAREVLTNQSQGIDALGKSYARDLALQDAIIRAMIASRDKLALGRVHREMIQAGYLVPSPQDPTFVDADLPAFLVAVGDPSKSSELVQAVRTGMLTQDAAQVWLKDYAALSRTSNGAALRESMLRALPGPRDALAQSQALLDAQAAHSKDVGATLVSLGADAKALGEYLDYRTNLMGSVGSADTWAELLRTSLPAGPRRDGAESLIRAIIQPK